MIEKSESQRRREAAVATLEPRRRRAPAKVSVTTSTGDTTVVAASRFRRKKKYVFSLTAAQRSALFAGGTPRITIPSGECPFEPGDVYDVPGTRNLSLGIIGLAEGDGTDVLIYSVFDQRPRLLRASVHSVDFDSIRRSMDSRGVPTPLEDAAAVADAAEESAYTTSPGASLKGEPEAIGRAEHEELISRGRDKLERKIRSPIAEINQRLAALEDDPIFVGQASTIRYLRGRVAKLEAERLKESGLE